MNKFFMIILTLACLSVTPVFADQADDLRILMTDAKGAIMLGDVNEAISFCDQALAIDSNFAEAYALRAEAKGLAEDIDAALADANKAIELAPDSNKIHSAYYVRSVISLDYSSEPDQALEFMNKAIELKNDDPFYYEFRGEIHTTLGNQDLADADFAKAESLNLATQ